MGKGQQAQAVFSHRELEFFIKVWNGWGGPHVTETVAWKA